VWTYGLHEGPQLFCSKLVKTLKDAEKVEQEFSKAFESFEEPFSAIRFHYANRTHFQQALTTSTESQDVAFLPFFIIKYIV
jgi:hypothetical protein